MVIEIKNIDKSFKKSKPVLRNLSLKIEKGECCGLVGLNGAGKTTLIRTILGLLKPNAGTVYVNGENPYGAKGLFYHPIGVLLENDGFNGNLTFLENLTFYGQIKKISASEVKRYAERHWIDLVEKKNPVKKYSRGQRVQCALARSFLGKPKLLIFDEPTATLDLAGQELFAQLVEKAKARGVTIIISSHRLETIAKLCDTVAHLKDGQITKSSLEDKKRWLLRATDNQNLNTSLAKFALDFEEGEIYTSLFGSDESEISAIIARLVTDGVALIEVRKEESIL